MSAAYLCEHLLSRSQSSLVCILETLSDGVPNVEEFVWFQVWNVVLPLLAP